jgi:hypothetical protein
MSTLSTTRDAGNTPADHAADHNTLHAAYNDERLFVPALALSTTGGLGTDYFTLADGGSSGVSSDALTFPDHWQTMHLDLLWMQGTASAGNYRHLVTLTKYPKDGSALSSTAATNTLSIAGPNNTSIWKRSRILTDAAITPVTHWYSISDLRLGADGADTGTGTVNVYGYIFVRAS